MSGWTISSVLFFLPLFAVVLRIHLKAAPRSVPPVAAHGSFGYLIPCSHPLGERAELAPDAKLAHMPASGSVSITKEIATCGLAQTLDI